MSSESPESAKNWWQRRSRIQKVLMVVVVLAVIGAALSGGEEDGDQTAVGGTTTTDAGVATTSAISTTAAAAQPTSTTATSPVTSTTADTTTTVAAPTTSATTTTSTTSRTSMPTTTSTPTTTSMPTTTTTEPSPVIEAGVYEVGEEFPPGVYRALPYWARLDEDQEIIDNDLTEDCPSIMIVEESDAFVEITGGALPIEESDPIDPFECTDGTFLVGLDIEVGQYTIQPVGGTTYWARLDESREIIDNHLGEGQAIMVIQETDYAVTFNGQLETDDS